MRTLERLSELQIGSCTPSRCGRLGMRSSWRVWSGVDTYVRYVQRREFDRIEIRPVSSGSLLLVSEAARNTLKFDIFSRIRIMQIAKKQKELSTRAHLFIYVIRSDSVA